ncbi:MAG: class I SAM-dependent methyltransferase, partial [bacterium]|nr:class I SAM-dependent methyltransferase [bacterium]
MDISKTWDWKKNEGVEWLEPSMESFYFANKWIKENKKRVLDLGCGLGRHSMLFYDYGFNVTACDITPYCINYLKNWQKERNISFPVIECDMLNMPFENNSFDCIYAYHVFSHTNLEGFKKMFNDIYKILDNDGEIFFDVLSKKCDLYTKSGFPKLDNNTILSNSVSY